MVYFAFNPFWTKSVIVRFECDKCSHQVKSEGISVPFLNFEADPARDNQIIKGRHAVCGKCKKKFTIDVHITPAGHDGYVNELPDDYAVYVEEINEPYYAEHYAAISSNTEFLMTFNQDLDNIISLLKIKPSDKNLKKLFHRQLYSSVIGIMETYLSDAFINTVFQSKDNLKRFFKTFKEFKKENIAVSNFFEFEEKAEFFAKKAMLDVIYHNLPKVSGMYKDTFGVEFPKSEELYKAVSKRHDFVHRNGKDKDGNEVIVDSSMIEKLVDDIRIFVTAIDDQIKN